MPSRRADVGVLHDRIAAVGDLADAPAARRLDASGCVVAPGFIDIHNHSDLVLLADGRAQSMLRQSVTTQVTGNGGLSPAPVNDAAREDLKKTLIPRVASRYVRDKGLLTLEEAVHKMTGKPARKLKLKRRGELRAGYFADLVVFDPAAFRDRATFEDPHQFAEGIHWVVVNGHLTLDLGVLADRLVGQVLVPG